MTSICLNSWHMQCQPSKALQLQKRRPFFLNQCLNANSKYPPPLRFFFGGWTIFPGGTRLSKCLMAFSPNHEKTSEYRLLLGNAIFSKEKKTCRVWKPPFPLKPLTASTSFQPLFRYDRCREHESLVRQAPAWRLGSTNKPGCYWLDGLVQKSS